MANVQLDYSDIEDIFKEKLKIENIVKKIKTIFLNERYLEKIDYKPYFQRNYVWDDEKASYFIESIILGTEIPPLVIFNGKRNKEVIDGRQRFETIKRFLSDKLTLKENGLHSLKNFSGKKYSQLPPEIQEIFEETRIRIIEFGVVDEPQLEEEKEDKIKKEIFRRYNSGIVPLKKFDIERASYISDELTQIFTLEINKNKRLYKFLRDTILPSSKRKCNQRDAINILVGIIRSLITLPYIPIATYARATSKADIINKSYQKITEDNSTEENIKIVSSFKRKVRLIKGLYQELNDGKIDANNLFFEVNFWALSVLEQEKHTITSKELKKIAEAYRIVDENNNIWKDIFCEEKNIYSVFEKTGSHYYSSINRRYKYVANIFNNTIKVNFTKYLKGNYRFDGGEELEELNHYKLNKPLPESLSIEDILTEMKRERFLIRPEYQRSEVTDIVKASYLMESILLGVSIPPIFVYKRDDKIKEVVDGQQRLLTIIGFLGKTYLDEKGKFSTSTKDKFKLSKLRILSNLNGKNIDTIEEEYENKILDFPIDVIEIDQSLNPEFSQIDLFLRLNSKPYPIKENTFEMWNAYISKEVTAEVKAIASQYETRVYRKSDNRMKLEELIVSLAYLEYKVNVEKVRVSNVLNVYVKNGKLCARIKNKDNVTRLLSDISNSNVKPFLSCLHSIKVFSQKIEALINDETDFRKMVQHSKKIAPYKTDQNFYFLWLMTCNVALDSIINKPDEYYKIISEKFEMMQGVQDIISVEEFVRTCLEIE